MIVSELSSQEAILTMVMMVILFLVLMTIEQSATSARYLYTHNMSWHFMRVFLESTDAPEPEKPKNIPSKQEEIRIEFRDVCYSYGQGSRMILDHFNCYFELWNAQAKHYCV